MSLLLAGVIILALVHFIPVFTPTIRTKIINKIGLMPYKGLFSLITLGSIVLIVLGYQNYTEYYYYPQMAGAREATMLLVFLAILLLVASELKTNIKRYTRNPQLTGITIWSLAHLLSNGEARAVVLFSGLFIWSYLLRIGINIRDGEWQKPEKVALMNDGKVLVIASVLYIVLAYTHIYFTGTPLM